MVPVVPPEGVHLGQVEGVVVSPRRQIVDDRGKVVHMLRADDPEFERFGEVYFSFVNPGWVKAWHWHKQMTLNYAVPYGQIRLAIYDDREHSPTRGNLMQLMLSPEEHRLVKVPPGIWNGFIGLAPHPSIVCNCSTLPHDPDEIVRAPYDDPSFPYDFTSGSVLGT